MDFNSVLIGSDNPQRLVDYYTKLFGEPAMSDGGYTGWALGSGWITIGPHSEVKGRNPQPGRMILNFETADVQGDFDRLQGGRSDRRRASPTASRTRRAASSRRSRTRTGTTSS